MDIKKTKSKEKKYKKDSFLKGEGYKTKKDLINSLLENKKEYSKKQVDLLIKKYLDMEV